MIVTPDTLESVLDKLCLETELGLDTETTGLGEDDRLFSIIISTATEVFYFDFNTDQNGAGHSCLDMAIFRSLSVNLFNSEVRAWFIHNAKFDMRMLAKEGIDLRGQVYCSYAIERVLQNNYFGKEPYSLHACAVRRGWGKDDQVKAHISKHKLYTNIELPGKKKIIQKPHYERVPFDVMTAYALQDGRLHYDIAKSQQLQVQEDEGKRGDIPSIISVIKNEVRLTKTLFSMERRGVRIDRRRTASALDYEISQIQSAQSAFFEATHREYVDSNKLLTEVFDAVGESYPRTAKGNPSFNAEALEGMTSPIANMVNKIRYHEKRAGTYYSSFLHLATKNDMIHADSRQAGTETGRMSYRDPNLQNVPKEDDPEDLETPYHVRECFIPEPGQFFYSIDYKQMELRMMFDYAGENKMIKRIMEGMDAHDATAEQCKITRKQAKTLNFAIGYGAGPDKIAKMLGIETWEAKELRQDYFGNLPRLAALFHSIRKSGEARGFVFNWLGRRCHISDSSFSYVLPNHLIQGGCADVVKVAMNRIDDMLTERKSPTTLRLQVHDELLISCPFGDERVVEPIAELMEKAYVPKNGMRLQVSIEHSLKSWGTRDKIKGTP